MHFFLYKLPYMSVTNIGLFWTLCHNGSTSPGMTWWKLARWQMSGRGPVVVVGFWFQDRHVGDPRFARDYIFDLFDLLNHHNFGFLAFSFAKTGVSYSHIVLKLHTSRLICLVANYAIMESWLGHIRALHCQEVKTKQLKIIIFLLEYMITPYINSSEII